GRTIRAARRTDAAGGPDILVRRHPLRLGAALRVRAEADLGARLGARARVGLGARAHLRARVGLGARAALRARAALGTGAVFPAVALTVSTSTAAYLLIELDRGCVGARCDHRCGRLAGRLGVAVIRVGCEGGSSPTKHE